MKVKLKLTKIDWLKILKKKSVEAKLIGFTFQQKELENNLSKDVDKTAFTELVAHQLDGFYSLIIQSKNGFYAAVDHIRSHPLFYASNEKLLFISDKAEWVRKQIGDEELCPIARDEFQLTGYVTGADTLFPNVKQLQAGELLSLENGTLSTERYYTFEHSEPDNFDETKLKQELYRVSIKATQRLIQYANGRQIVIPLSGGYDSRLIASLLKQAQYENILCFTYGLKGNKEAKYSKQVADSLGLRWHFVEYTEKLWDKAWQTKQRKNYSKYAANHVSLPHIQDWLAVKIMHNNKIIEPNAVFAPGHSGDMVAGSHIPSFIFENRRNNYSLRELSKHLFDKHYSLTSTSNIKTNPDIFYKKIKSAINKLENYTRKEFANESELHNWQNRQAKYICNSIRVYESFGYDWWMPLWDKPFINFFESLPLRLRDHTWYVNFVSEQYERISGGSILKSSSEKSLIILLLKKMLGKTVYIRKIAKSIYQMIKHSKTSNVFGLVLDKDEYKKLRNKNYSVLGVFVVWYLNEFYFNKD